MLVARERIILPSSRRFFLGAAVASLASAVARPAETWTRTLNGAIAPSLLRQALDALERHRGSLVYRDVVGIADFSLSSATPRFYLMALASGSESAHLVAHGRGSDPAHTGWLERFSNEPHSNATSAGAYRTERRLYRQSRPLAASRRPRPNQQQRRVAGARGTRRVVRERGDYQGVRQARAQPRLPCRSQIQPGRDIDQARPWSTDLRGQGLGVRPLTPAPSS